MKQILSKKYSKNKSCVCTTGQTVQNPVERCSCDDSGSCSCDGKSRNCGCY